MSPERELHYAINNLGITPKCNGREVEYVDYLKPPTRLEAELMCEGCPLLELCGETARKRRPAWGVWGGRVYGVQRKVKK